MAGVVGSVRPSQPKNAHTVRAAATATPATTNT